MASDVATDKARDDQAVSHPEERSEGKSNSTPGKEDLATSEKSQSSEGMTSGTPEPHTANSPTPSSQSRESGEASPVGPTTTTSQPESISGDAAPPLPAEPVPPPEDDGWDFHWDEIQQAYFFYNRFTNQTTWDNPRLASGSATTTDVTSTTTAAEPPKDERPPAGGYNPAIHGDYDPNAWYAQPDNAADGGAGDDANHPADPGAAYATMGSFNRFTGQWQSDEQNPERHGDEAKSKRQMNAYFDVDAAANVHDGRSLKAERAGKKPSKSELKHFKEKRRAKKEEKRRAWLRD